MASERGRWPRAPAWLSSVQRWWFGELAAQFPRAARWLAGTDDGTRLVCHPGQTVLRAPGNVELRRWDTPLAALTDVQRSELRAAAASGEVDVELSPAQALQIEVRIPEAARDLGQAVRLALLADSPLRLEAIVYDWRLPAEGTGRGLRPGWKTVRVALCRRATLAEMQAPLAAAGLTLRRWLVRDHGADSAPFVLQTSVAPRARWRLPTRPLLLVCALVILLSGPLLVGGGSLLAERSVRNELAALQARQQASLALAQRAARAEAVAEELLRWQSRPLLAARIDDLATRLPDDAWLTELSVDGATLKAVGMAADPSAAARAIGASAGLEGVRIERRTGGGDGGGASAFELGARLGGVR